MRKLAIFMGLFMAAFAAQAAVTVDTAPASLVTSATELAADSELAVFEFALTGDAGETLESLTVTVNSASAVAADLDEVAVYKDDGDGSYDSSDDQAGANSTVNVGSTTVVNTTSNNALDGEKFFVVLETDSSWAGTDSVTVTLNTDGIETSDNSPTSSAVNTAAISAPDEAGPVLQTAVAMNESGSTAGKEAGDSVVLTFNEATNKPVVNSANIDEVFDLNNGHSWLDGASSIGSATWNDAGTVMTVVLSDATSLPTVAVGDTVTVDGDVVEDEDGNPAEGNRTITGSFAPSTNDDDEDEDDDEGDEDDDDFGRTCTGGIINGKLYRVEGSQTVYLAAACRLKPFRGAAVFHARGHKFQNIISLSSLDGLAVSEKPALPAGGTLVKGSDATVWFVTEHGKRKGFTSERSFRRLGFNFGAVKNISDSDLQELLEDSIIDEDDSHPEGAVLKCTTSSTVYMMKGNRKLAFTNPVPYLERGHTWDAVAVVDCQNFTYPEGENIAS